VPRWDNAPQVHSRVLNYSLDIWIWGGPYAFPMKNFRRTANISRLAYYIPPSCYFCYRFLLIHLKIGVLYTAVLFLLLPFPTYSPQDWRIIYRRPVTFATVSYLFTLRLAYYILPSCYFCYRFLLIHLKIGVLYTAVLLLLLPFPTYSP
jgi:hypothetical protein